MTFASDRRTVIATEESYSERYARVSLGIRKLFVNYRVLAKRERRGKRKVRREKNGFGFDLQRPKAI